MDKVIEIKDLNYTYPDGQHALKGVELDILQGESIGIIGPNGAGKTTLLLHLNGILRGRGSIKVMGMEMNNKNLNKIRSRVGIVFQDPDDQLFSPTVFDDVSFGPLNLGLSSEEVLTRTKEALKQAGMEGFENHSSHHLSFGEKKQVSMATIFSMKPEVLVLDEPTSNLAPQLRRKLIDLLKKAGGTRIIATHDLEMVLDLCGRVILLNKGEIIINDKTRKVLGDRALMESNGLEVPWSIRK